MDISAWIFRLCAVSVCGGVIGMLAKDSSYEKYVSFVCSLAVLVCTVSPLAKAIALIPKLFENNAVISGDLGEYTLSGDEIAARKVEEIIKSRTADFIKSKTGTDDFELIQDFSFENGTVKEVSLTLSSKNPLVETVLEIKKDIILQGLESLFLCDVKVVIS